MTIKNTVASICAIAAALAGCGKEPPPRSVQEFMEDRILLEATMVRCGQDRSATRYDAECINARDAVDRIAAAREQARREELEAQSEQKRQALRRARQAAEEARRRAQEAERRRKEAEYYGEFEPLPPGDEESEDPDAPRSEPGDSDVGTLRDPSDEESPQGRPAGLPAGDSSPSGTGAGTGSGTDAGDASLEEVREELRRRQETGESAR